MSLPFMLVAAADSAPSVANLVFTSAVYALIGYGLARLRWWAALPLLVFLAITLSATFKRWDDFRAAGAFPPDLPTNYRAYHVMATVVAAAIIILGMRSPRWSRRSRDPVDTLPPVG